MPAARTTVVRRKPRIMRRRMLMPHLHLACPTENMGSRIEKIKIRSRRTGRLRAAPLCASGAVTAPRTDHAAQTLHLYPYRLVMKKNRESNTGTAVKNFLMLSKMKFKVNAGKLSAAPCAIARSSRSVIIKAGWCAVRQAFACRKRAFQVLNALEAVARSAPFRPAAAYVDARRGDKRSCSRYDAGSYDKDSGAV